MNLGVPYFWLNTLVEVMLIVILLIWLLCSKESPFLCQKTTSPSQIAFLHLHCLSMTWIVFSSASKVARKTYGYQREMQLQYVKKWKKHVYKSCAALWPPNLLVIILKPILPWGFDLIDDPLDSSSLAYPLVFSFRNSSGQVGGTKALASVLFSPSGRSCMFIPPKCK